MTGQSESTPLDSRADRRQLFWLTIALSKVQLSSSFVFRKSEQTNYQIESADDECRLWRAAEIESPLSFSLAGPGGQPDGRLVRHDRGLHDRAEADRLESLSRANHGGAISSQRRDGSVVRRRGG